MAHSTETKYITSLMREKMKGEAITDKVTNWSELDSLFREQLGPNPFPSFYFYFFIMNWLVSCKTNTTSCEIRNRVCHCQQKYWQRGILFRSRQQLFYFSLIELSGTLFSPNWKLHKVPLLKHIKKRQKCLDFYPYCNLIDLL